MSTYDQTMPDPLAWEREQLRYPPRLDRRAVRMDDYLHKRAAVDLKFRWRQSCELVNHLGHPSERGRVGNPVAVHVDPGRYYGDPAYMIVELHPGQTIADLEDVASELAHGLGAWRVTFRPTTSSRDYVRVDLVMADPLARVIHYPLSVPRGHIALGRDEYGGDVAVRLEQLTNIIAQGATRSGKTGFVYQVLAQLAGRPDVEVAGIDPTTKILRPFGQHPQGWRVWGTRDATERYLAVVTALVEEMDRRIEEMPLRRDTVQLGSDCPLIVVVLEEWAGVARLTGHTRHKPSAVHAGVTRLLAEGMKAGIRVITLVQRAEADYVGVFERGQAETTLTFGSPSGETLKMLHTGDANEMAEAMAGGPKGAALLSLPGRDPFRVRAPWIGGDDPDGYPAYVDAVQWAIR